MKELAERVAEAVADGSDRQMDFLNRLVSLETPTEEPERTRLGLEMLAYQLGKIGYRCRIFRGNLSGGQLMALPADRVRGRPIQLLIGHVDTVWPAGTIKDMPVTTEEGLMRGPGVFDMKTGLVNAIFALRALKQLKLDPEVTPLVFINTDEETGSKESLGRLCRLAKIAERAYVMEPALGMTGQLKTARKGVGNYEITARGVAAHAGLDPEGGASAILELSHVIQSLFALNDHKAGVTINVGRIDGGLGANIIAPVSTCQVDVRVPTAKHAAEIDTAIANLDSATPGVQLEISGGLRRPPLEPCPESRRLWAEACAIAERMGIEIEEGMAGGGSDGNNTSQYTPTLDGLGAVGDGAHAHHEFVYIEKIPERTALLAQLILAPSLATRKEDPKCTTSCALP